MEPQATILEPLSAFQALSFAMAAAVAVEAWRSRSWTGGGITLAFAALAIFTKPIAGYSPAAKAMLSEIGSSAVSGWIVIVAAVAIWITRNGMKTTKQVAESEGVTDDKSYIQKHLDEINAAFDNKIEKANIETQRLQTIQKTTIEDYQTVLARLTQFSEKIEKVEKALSDGEIAKIGHATHKRLLREKLSAIAQDAEELAQRYNATSPMDPADNITRMMEVVRFRLIDAGWDEAELNDAFARVSEQVRTDGLYASILPDDEGRFTNIEDKRRWHSRNGHIEYMRSLLDTEIKTLGDPRQDCAEIRIIR